MHIEAKLMAWVLALLACLLVSYALVPTLTEEPTPEMTEARMREELRPVGDFRELVYERLALLQAAGTDEGSCRSAHELANLFRWLNENERRAIDDGMITRMAALLDQDTLLGTHRCLSYVFSGIFMTIGPRAIAAVPSLERALKAAEIARSARVSIDAECAGFRFNPDRQLDYLLREALISIDGQLRTEGYTLKCPKDGAQSH